MVIWIDENRKIYAVNNILTKSEAEQYINSVNCFWFDEPLPIVEAPENKGVSYDLTEDNTIEVVFFDIEPEIPEPTQLDRIEAKIDKSQQDIIDNYTLELIESGML